MNLLFSILKKLAIIFHPYRRLSRLLLSRHPMFWAERYHFVFLVAVVFFTGVGILGLVQGFTTEYSTHAPFRIPIEYGLWAVPWCISLVWFWNRAKGYDAVPIAKIYHGVYYGIFDAFIIGFLLLIPSFYTSAFQTGLRTHIKQIENTAQDECKLKAAWNLWFDLKPIPNSAIDQVSRPLKDEKGSRIFNKFNYGGRVPKVLEGIKSSIMSEDILARMGVVETNLIIIEKGLYRTTRMFRDNPSFDSELAKLETILQPLLQKYAGIDLTPYLMAGTNRIVSANDFSVLLMRPELAQCESAFIAFNAQVIRADAYGDLDTLPTQAAILFGVLLSTLAIPATSVRSYWVACGVLLAGVVCFTYCEGIFESRFDGGIIMFITCVVASVMILVLLLALTSRKIGKNNWIKAMSVYVAPASLLGGLVVVSKLFDSGPIKIYLGVAVALGANGFSRLVFNRLRSLPDSV